MTFTTGMASYFGFDDPTGSIYDFSPYVTSLDHPFDVDTHETTTFGQPSVTRVTGLKDKKISVSMIFDATADRRIAPMVGQIGTYKIGPNGSGSGAVRYTGEALCTDVSVSDPHDGLITMSVEFEIDNTSTRDTF